MGQSEVIRKLRESTGSIAQIERELWLSPSLSPDIAKGIVVELLGNARTEWLLRFFKLNPEPYIFWCEQEPTVHPTAIAQRGICLERIKFINYSQDLQSPLRLALDSGFYPFIIAPNRFKEIKIFQRFHLLAEKSKSTLFLLGDKTFSSAWPISLQMEINFSDSEDFYIQIQKQKYGQKQ